MNIKFILLFLFFSLQLQAGDVITGYFKQKTLITDRILLYEILQFHYNNKEINTAINLLKHSLGAKHMVKFEPGDTIDLIACCSLNDYYLCRHNDKIYFVLKSKVLIGI